jgi:murein L,D-transpeptidase YcbB/YkuD
VRVADPLALAVVLLEDPTGGPSWTRAALDELAASGLTRVLPMPTPMPVVYAPWTAWVPPDGMVSFRPGSGPRDAAIIAGLEARAGR